MSKDMSRRDFLASAAALGAFHLVPRHVVGGPGYVAPSDKITLAHVGCGSEGLREIAPLLASPDIQIVAACDPNRDSHNYVDWAPNMLKYILRAVIQEPTWREGEPGIPGGREVMKEIVETFYAKNRESEGFKGVATYADFREMFAKESDIDAIKIMTPDHHHAGIAIAAMNQGIHVCVHKPLANRMTEVRKVIQTAEKTGVATYFMPWGSNGSMDLIMTWINDGAIGTLREVHNWTNRPVWPQYQQIPTDTPPIPDGFDWDLWLGPAAERAYHPHYTHAVFRGWYDFGGGAICDMGHYSLWAVLKALGLGAPISAEATPSSVAAITDQVSTKVINDFSFPLASSVRFKYAPVEGRAPVEVWWYDGGMRPRTPDELEEDNEEMPAEGMLFIGDNGKILTGFQLQNPRMIPKAKMAAYSGPQPPEEAPPPWAAMAGRQTPGGLPAFLVQMDEGLTEWVAEMKGGPRATGSFVNAGPISETANLAAVAYRAGGKVVYDSTAMKITNTPSANALLTRAYRAGWEL